MEEYFYDEFDRRERAIFEALSNNLTNSTNQDKSPEKRPNKELEHGTTKQYNRIY